MQGRASPMVGAVLALALAAGTGAALCWWLLEPRKRQTGGTVRQGVLDLIGNTPLVRVASLSEETGCEIWVKAEMLNPGGSVKDRVALQIVSEALADGRLRPGGLITEGTAGSTGVSLAMVAAAYGCRCSITMPDDAAIEKANMIQAYGASVRRVRPVSIVHPEHPVNVARREAASTPGALFADQFENEANFRAHLKTGEEIWQQTQGRVHAFVSGAGTGGTVAGVSTALKARNPRVRVFLVDPPGSSLFNKVKRGVMYTSEEAEGKRLKNPFDTITEGIGINRLTANFNRALIDDAFRGTDREAVEMAAYLLRNEGLWVGSSAAMNCVGAVKAARAMGPGHTIVTLLCDGGHRHLSKFHSKEYLESMDLAPRETDRSLAFVS
ncbi:hypothetical protein CHLRE_16g664250v5 [Chlamydomonas reinhardtii]|uniref:cysteine synthase n=1 Tax=Chlamydomonas reinhardtii TaxID=3055 RepID=A8JFA4_CHLRE|nr:uncharacterized protein CHLRE_16g664250v5 [Chlamydomonas reinhardtii]PNW71677.1 hypothetical protein CHLRE_16g664250v5 [Chlamydomonas reinhardtii]|eukprot:XP_001701454.1 cysteine synthase [Chlamydomonas reinhardtii]